MALARRSEVDVVGHADDAQDVPYGEDWHSVAEVEAWSAAADRKRPWRSQFRDAIAGYVAALGSGARVLELGSGPGLLAENVLARCPGLAGYTLLDFSEPMLALSRDRLSRFSSASFLCEDFRADAWVERVGAPFDESARSQSLYMTESEQVQALTAGGFMGVEVVLSVSKLVLYVARRTSEQEPPG